ncbi:NAD-dependent epimerase/dehydratase family protein [Kitasatospora sp. NPDC052896]|uniref:NAD-dependent epimerase/dehydratase family protein n=1 Tax=Kitasatospora sp. NPDC052896 TaxID=3364061 RepID=UPI0037C771C5
MSLVTHIRFGRKHERFRMKVLIAGGASFVGDTIASVCIDHGIEPVILGNIAAARGEIAAGHTFYVGDISDVRLVERILADHPDIFAVFDCTALMTARASAIRPVSEHAESVTRGIRFIGHIVRDGCPRFLSAPINQIGAEGRSEPPVSGGGGTGVPAGAAAGAAGRAGGAGGGARAKWARSATAHGCGGDR